MDTRHLFDTLARQEQPPLTVDVNRAIAAGRAARGHRRTALGAVSALSVLAVATVWLALPRPGAVSAPAASASVSASVGATPTATPAEPSGAWFTRMKKKYPPVGRVAFVPDVPAWTWLGTAGKKPVLCTTSGDPDGVTCAGFPPLSAGEFARTQSTQPLRRISLGIAGDEVRGVTATTPDGRRIPGTVARGVGAGLGVWAVKYPPGVRKATLAFTDANGKTLRRFQGGW
ncbi:hypothetical protein [Streptosporangium saharense]|uniref:hypothetical protein n=1 Tax=Streptosporangium saharense TaxID=1706840 RepID=UPI00341232AF